MRRLHGADALRWQEWRDHPATAGLCIGCLVFLAVIGIRSLGALQSLELGAFDVAVRLGQQARTLGEGATVEPEVVLVGITEADLDRLGWPLPDDVVTELLEGLLRFRPRAIGLDLFRDRPVAPRNPDSMSSGATLDELLQAHDQIIAVSKFASADGGYIPPPAAIANDPQRFGFSDILVDSDGTVRRGLLYLDDGEGKGAAPEVQASFALRLALRFLRPHGIHEVPDAEAPMHLRLGSATFVPMEKDVGPYVDLDARGYQYLLGYPLDISDLPAVSIAEIFEGAPSVQRVTDKLLLVGTTAESVKDLFFSPLYNPSRNDHGTFGIVLHAQMATQLIRAALGQTAPMRFLPQAGEAGWIWLWCVLGTTCVLAVRSPLPSILAVFGTALMLLGTSLVVFVNGMSVPVVPSLLGVAASSGLTYAYLSVQELRQKRALMRLFSAYVSPLVADELWRQRHAFADKGRPRPQQLMATVLFSDIRGFTTVAEVLPPEDLVPWLNEYMEAMAGLVLQHGGVIEKFAGDGITATFGIPVPRTTEAEIANDAQSAVRSALGMAQELDRLNALWKARGLPEIGIRVGINTGPLVVGSIGSAERMQYSIIGDTANTAARLESYAKDSAETCSSRSYCRILISESTRRYLDAQYELRPVGSLALKGKAIAVTVHSVIGRRGECRE